MVGAVPRDLDFHEPVAKPRDQIAKFFLQCTVGGRAPPNQVAAKRSRGEGQGRMPGSNEESDGRSRGHTWQLA